MQLPLKSNFLLMIVFCLEISVIKILSCSKFKILQNDLDTISSWAEKWLMELNINKCSVLSITVKHGTTPKQVTNHDYLGLTISSDLNRFGHANFFLRRLAERLVYLKQPYHPAHKTRTPLPTKCLYTLNLNMLVKSGTHIQ